LAVSLIGVFISLRLKASHRAGIITLLLIVGWLVDKDARLQRFTTLNADTVVTRIGWSVNSSFVDVLVNYPMGNGLGGGGTSIPYFLQERLKDPVLIENEYARILVEEGVPGLLAWTVF